MSKLKILFVVLISIIFILAVILYIPGNVEPPVFPSEKLPNQPPAASKVTINFISTATGKTKKMEALGLAQGSLLEEFEMVHGAILVTHDDDTFLFDTGLGKNIDAQFTEDMPFWLKSMLAYKKGLPAVEQLQSSPVFPQPSRIFLSHVHWDHASGIGDFPDLEIWITSDEYDYLKSTTSFSVFPSQVNSEQIKWKKYQLNEISYAGFSQSLDIYDDGTVVLVDLSGHSPGSVGLFVNANDGVRRFFVGDAVWNLKEVAQLKHKFWISSLIADDDLNATSAVISKLHALLQANPELKIIPAHDLSTWK